MPKEKESALSQFKSEITNILSLQKKQKTFLEILKISKREVPIANLLAYFFRANESHTLGDLFIRSLLETVSYDLKTGAGVKELHLNAYTVSKNKLVSHTEFSYSDLAEISELKVHTEKKTNEQKRIDIVIEAKQFIIAIEFKINHLLDNPLENYEKYICDTYCKKESKPLFFVVLTPWQKPHEDASIKNESFRQITLSSLVAQVKLNLPDDINRKIKAKKHDVFYLMDFITTVENRKKNFELRDILLKKTEILDLYEKLPISSLLVKLKSSEDEKLRNAISTLKNLDGEVQKKLRSVIKELKLKSKEAVLLSKEKCFNGCILLKIQNHYAIKVRLSIKGWMLELWQKTEESGYQNKIRNLYQKEIDFETSTSSIVMKITQHSIIFPAELL